MLLEGNILWGVPGSERQHWLITHVARKEGSDNFKMGRGLPPPRGPCILSSPSLTFPPHVRYPDDAAIPEHQADFARRNSAPFSARGFLRTFLLRRENRWPAFECGVNPAQWHADVRCAVSCRRRVRRSVD